MAAEQLVVIGFFGEIEQCAAVRVGGNIRQHRDRPLTSVSAAVSLCVPVFAGGNFKRHSPAEPPGEPQPFRRELAHRIADP